MGERHETVAQTAGRLRLLLYRGSVSASRAVSVIRSLEAEVAKLKAARDGAAKAIRAVLRNATPGDTETFPGQIDPATPYEVDGGVLVELAKHQGGSVEV